MRLCEILLLSLVTRPALGWERDVLKELLDDLRPGFVVGRNIDKDGFMGELLTECKRFFNEGELWQCDEQSMNAIFEPWREDSIATTKEGSFILALSAVSFMHHVQKRCMEHPEFECGCYDCIDEQMNKNGRKSRAAAANKCGVTQESCDRKLKFARKVFDRLQKNWVHNISRCLDGHSVQAIEHNLFVGARYGGRLLREAWRKKERGTEADCSDECQLTAQCPREKCYRGFLENVALEKYAHILYRQRYKYRGRNVQLGVKVNDTWHQFTRDQHDRIVLQGRMNSAHLVHVRHLQPACAAAVLGRPCQWWGRNGYRRDQPARLIHCDDLCPVCGYHQVATSVVFDCNCGYKASINKIACETCTKQVPACGLPAPEDTTSLE